MRLKQPHLTELGSNSLNEKTQTQNPVKNPKNSPSLHMSNPEDHVITLSRFKNNGSQTRSY